MGGVDDSPAMEGLGVVWLVLTNDIKDHRGEFLREGHRWIDAIQRTWPLITNLVDARNTLHIRWLRWLGFVFTQRIERWGARSVPFLEFARHQSACV